MSNTNRNIIIAVAIVIVVSLVIFFAVKAHRAAAPTTMPIQTGSTASATGTPAETVTGVPTSTPSSTALTSSTKSYGNGSFSLAYPSSWTIYEYTPFSVDNFGGQYTSGVIIPAGGAELDVVTTTVYNGDAAVIQTELLQASNLSTSTTAIDGVPCVQATYQYDYAVGKAIDDNSLYCLQGTELWKIYFSYNNGDAAAAAHLAVFKDILASMKLTASQ